MAALNQRVGKFRTLLDVLAGTWRLRSPPWVACSRAFHFSDHIWLKSIIYNFNNERQKAFI